MDQFLPVRGFVLHRFFPIPSRALAPMTANNDIYASISQAVWADAVFVRGFTRLQTFADRQGLAAASILHECYASFDLVLDLLLEYGRGTEAALGPAYFARLQGRSQDRAA